MVLISACAELSASTPYGKFGNPGTGILTIAISPKIGWFLMELPCSVMFIYQFYIVQIYTMKSFAYFQPFY